MQFHAGWKGRGPFALVARALAGGALGLALISMPATTRGQAAARPVHISATSRNAALDWDRQIGRLADAGTLRLAKSRPDTVMDGRTHDRFDQYYGAARVFGAQLVRQRDGAQAVSVFGTVHPDIAIDATPALTLEQARDRAVEIRRPRAAGSRARAARPAARGRRCAVRAGVAGGRGHARRRLQPLHRREDRRRSPAHHRTSRPSPPSAAAAARSATKRRSASIASARTYFADDRLRPPTIVTLDMRGNLARTINILEGFINPAQSDIASDTDNNWTDTPVVDAHVYLGWTYDYFFKRFGRRGLDNNDRPIRAIVHPVSRADVFQHINDDEIFGTFYLNAFWCGECGGGMMMFGEGLPPNFTVDVAYFSAALDVVGHELTHGVTEYSSNLIYQGESGALNEAFSDMMGASVEFFFQPTRADWLIARRHRDRRSGPRAFARGSAAASAIPITTASATPVPRTTAASTSIRRSRATRSTSRSRAARTARPAARCRAWASRIASRSRRCSIARSCSCCRRTRRSRSRVRRRCRPRRISMAEAVLHSALSARRGTRSVFSSPHTRRRRS